LGKITSWDDPAIRKLNPDTKLPSKSIEVVHRMGGSGTTFLFTDFLSKLSPEWKTKNGAHLALEWPIGIAAKTNGGVALNVANTPGSIGYVEYAYAKQTNLTYTRLINRDRTVVEPSVETFAAAAEHAKWLETSGFGDVLTNKSGPASWPISGATFILMHKRPRDPTATCHALDFFRWVYEKGDKTAEKLDYVVIPKSTVNDIQISWQRQIVDSVGRPLCPPPQFFKAM
jgi:phosphate transport system substrate-binding protein